MWSCPVLISYHGFCLLGAKAVSNIPTCVNSHNKLSVISGFRRDADEICALLGYNAASSGNPLPTFRDNVSVQSSRVKKSKKSKGLPLDAA
jgi:hypothetical protein